MLATMRLAYALLASGILWLAATGRLEPSPRWAWPSWWA